MNNPTTASNNIINSQTPSTLSNSFRLSTPSAKPNQSSINNSLRSLLDRSRQLQSTISNSNNNHHHHHQQQQQPSSSLNITISSPLSITNGSSLPTVQLGLDQIESQSRRLISKIRRNDSTDQLQSLIRTSTNNLSSNDTFNSSLNLINGPTNSSKAHYLLAGAGVNAEELGKTIDAVDLRGSFEPLQPLQDTDVEGYLRHEHEQSIIASIEEGRRLTVQEFYQTLDRSLRQNWEDYKELMFEELARHQPQSDSEPTTTSILKPPGSSNLYSDLNRTPPNSSPDLTLRNRSRISTSDPLAHNILQPQLTDSISQTNVRGRMLRYDQAVAKLNQRRRQNAFFPVTMAFREACLSDANDSDRASSQPNPLTETWNLLAQLVREKEVGTNDQGKELIGGIRLTTISDERKYAKHYLGDPNSLDARNVRKQLTEGARTHLEKQFLNHIEIQIKAHPVEANLGGDPSVANRVRAFVDLKFRKNGSWVDKRLEIINNTAVWARIFYLLRIGHHQDAIQFTKSQEQQLRKTEPNFLSYFSSWVNSSDLRLTKTLRDRFLAEYNQRIREVSGADAGFGNSLSQVHTAKVDPFKHVVYKIIGRVEIQRKNVPVAIASMEDWIWLQLALVNEPDEPQPQSNQAHPNTQSSTGSNSQDRYGLEDFGQVITKYGESHFDPNGNRPLMYFRVLLMSGQFEKAILFLQQRPHYQLDAVHFAIALAYYGLLRISDNSASHERQLSSSLSKSQLPTVNFARLIYRYSRLFSKNLPEVALQYLYLICLNSDVQPPEVGKQQVMICHNYIRELAVESGSHEELLGDVRNNGKRVPGMIERDLSLIKLSDSGEYLDTIVKQAAERALGERRLRDAIRLFNLAEEYDRVIAVLNIELGNSLSQPGRGSSINNNSGTSRNGSATVSLTASEDIVRVAENIIEHYDRNSSISSRISRKNRETCGLLLRLKNVLELHEQGKNEQALVLLDSVDILPTGNDLVQIIRKSELIKDLDEGIIKNLDIIILNGMNILFKVFNELKESPYGDLSRQTRMAEIKTKARAITTFAGMLRYRLSSETYSQLSRLQAYLH
ncbi:Nup93/Nic96-domain-containing protein [Phakopsora pachyrhizi]|uniref:Nup93/Nic96-domain-containing protein n=1 Tax=Phakopsora pachyrhizi TaxID=170000 RepID=A0AAV0BTD7_PHAPC|nr:Nup93/Nic96-domain-containing protein [Phakopsora pachyrhizi]